MINFNEDPKRATVDGFGSEKPIDTGDINNSHMDTGLKGENLTLEQETVRTMQELEILKAKAEIALQEFDLDHMGKELTLEEKLVRNRLDLNIGLIKKEMEKAE